MSHDGRHLFVGGDDGVCAFRADDGDLKWHFPTTRGVTAVPIIKDGLVYIVAHDHTVYVLDAASGRQQWFFNAILTRRIEQNPVLQVQGSTAYLYFVEQHGAVHCLSWPEKSDLSQTGAQKLQLVNMARSLEDDGQLKDAVKLYQMGQAWEDAARVWKSLEVEHEYANALFYLARERHVDLKFSNSEKAFSWEQAGTAFAAIKNKVKAQFCRNQVALFRKLPIFQVDLTIENLVVGTWSDLLLNIQNNGFGAAHKLSIQLKSPDFETEKEELKRTDLPHESNWQPSFRVKPQIIGEQLLEFELCYQVGKNNYTEEISWPCQIVRQENDLEINLIQAFRNQIKDVFTLEELKTLCTDLRISYDDFPKDNLTSFIRELIGYMQRYGKLDALIDVCQRERSHKDWEQFRKIEP